MHTPDCIKLTNTVPQAAAAAAAGVPLTHTGYIGLYPHGWLMQAAHTVYAGVLWQLLYSSAYLTSCQVQELPHIAYMGACLQPCFHACRRLPRMHMQLHSPLSRNMLPLLPGLLSCRSAWLPARHTRINHHSTAQALLRSQGHKI